MTDREVFVDGEVRIAGAFCLPDGVGDSRLAAVLIIGGTGGDTRDGDLASQASANASAYPGRRGTLRQIAHALAGAGIASLRFDKRGVGASGGDAASSDYDTDLEDLKTLLAWLRIQPEVDSSRVAVLGHSAGVLLACLLCRDDKDIAAACLLAGLFGPADEMIRWNWGRPARHWEEFSPEQREWLIVHQNRAVAAGLGVEGFLRAARAGEPVFTVEGQGVRFDFPTHRARQDIDRPCGDEFRHVYCPALLLHGGEDLNVHVQDSLLAYQALRAAGNDRVELRILPGLEHNFITAADSPAERIWERVSLGAFGRPMAKEALSAITEWLTRVLVRPR